MMYRRIGPLLAMTMLAGAVAACGGGADAANNAAESTAGGTSGPEPAAANEIAATSQAGSAEAQYMIGKWSAIGEDCADTLEFRNDGKVVTPVGEAKWAMAGDKLTIDYGDGSKPTTTTIKQLSADRIEITTDSGRKETQKRC